MEAAALADRRRWRARRRARRRLGQCRKDRRRQIKGQGRREGQRHLGCGSAARDARFRPRHHDDPRLSHARPSACQSRSARARAAARSRRAASVELWLHRSRLRSQDLHRQGAWASNSRRSARCWRSCGAPIAARSASNSCIFPIRRKNPGSRSASKAPARRSASPAKASARS